MSNIDFQLTAMVLFWSGVTVTATQNQNATLIASQILMIMT